MIVSSPDTHCYVTARDAIKSSQGSNGYDSRGISHAIRLLKDYDKPITTAMEADKVLKGSGKLVLGRVIMFLANGNSKVSACSFVF